MSLSLSCLLSRCVGLPAGSEGAKAALSKDQQAEARDINRSLLTLGKVVFELAKGGQAGHVPFRDSQLTRLLKVGGAVPLPSGWGANTAAHGSAG